ncbi:MAG: hypothetical protein KJ995_01985 [Candidatus Omnitrophica bacterium]|nr:hypothetical protein [Candidatus Omnitrophota bacterium]MBU1128046.1 hypothetical protein [Candidatus Omnitrophota bacterium]MBU1657373.1 hypothetical protein [Candidatus Omnitrophota bacterium]MBU1784633.1 hypothetical protein [Candidatus Omnitrophota bacterium]MBU1851161.1 hypothetical protein [Candidatus Omnitrophota bacterium]
MRTGKSRISAVILLCVAAMLWFLVEPAIADEVTDTIKTALTEYKNGEYASAAENLDYAQQQIRQKKGDKLKSFLPEALEGWTADDSSFQTIGSIMLGGGIIAERQYSKEASLVNVKIVADAPMLRGVMMMFTNPMFITAGGGELEQVKGQKAIIKYTPERETGEINVVVADRILVTVAGDSVKKQALIDYAESIDYRKLAKI